MQAFKPQPMPKAPCLHAQRLSNSGVGRICPTINRAKPVPRAATDHQVGFSEEPEAGAKIVVDGQVEEQLRQGWDPDNVFASAKPLAVPSGMDLFAAREARRRAAASGTNAAGSTAPTAPTSAPAHPPVPAPPPATPEPKPSPSAVATPPMTSPTATAANWQYPLRPLPAAYLPQGGVPGGVDCPEAGYIKAAYQRFLSTRYMSVDLDTPGLRVLHLDPPVLVVDGFWPAAKCQQLMDAASNTGLMATSKIGAGNAASSVGANAYDMRRTSSSMLLEPGVQARSPALAACVKDFQRHFLKLLQSDAKRWGKPGWLPSPGQCCFESPQVAKYETGQHFLAHEDGFPVRLARSNGFQRRATLLLYLNDVERGGYTCFDHLEGMAVQPRQGRLLIFFPSTSDARSDARSLHTAMDAADTKWVMQQWVASGVSPDAPLPPALPVPPVAVPAGFDLLSSQAGEVQGGSTSRVQASDKNDGATSAGAVKTFDVSMSLPADAKSKKQSKAKRGAAKKGFAS